MTEEEFKKCKFQAFMIIDYVSKRNIERVSCVILSINFETGILELEKLDYDIEYKYRLVYVHYTWCEKPYSALKLLKKK